ncbi:MAG: flagellar filament capping protein FliD [Lachnospiraceae bacterium]|nr:flagellar filament capping protein FliD [Lachnospiraceae bacterium]
MAMRLSGLMSGMDTESIIQELVAAKQTKVDDAKKAQTKLSWKQDAWKSLNTKLKNLQSKYLSSMRFSTAYAKKTTKVSDSSKVSVITGENAVDGVQSLEVKQLAKTGYLTGARIGGEDNKLTALSKLGDLGIDFGEGGKGTFTVKASGKSVDISVTADTTISDILTKLKDVGLNANFDANQQRLFISSKKSGADNDFSITASDANGRSALEKLGLQTDLSRDKATLAEYQTYAGYYVPGDEAATLGNMRGLIDKTVEERTNAYLDQYKNLVSSKEDAQKKIDEINEKYKDTSLKTVEEYAELLDAKNKSVKEIEEAIKNETDPDRKKQLETELKILQDDVKKLSDQKADATTLAAQTANVAKYDEQMADIRTYINVSEDTVDGVTAYSASATDKLTAEVEKRYLDKAEYAATVMKDYQNGKLTGSATKVSGQDALITLNDAEFTSNDNTFAINGLTFTALSETKEGEKVTVTTQNDTDGIYDMVKNFLKEYNAIVNEMDKLYNADSAKGYEPLTDEEKDAMSEREIEEWETKVKDALLRRDENLSSINSALQAVMSSGIEVNGKTMYLHDFGIDTLGYFNAPDNEKHAYHIDGDPDDANTSGNADKLKSLISNDPDTVVSFFTQLSRNLYGKMSDLSSSVDGYRSYGNFYEDKKMKSDYDDYTSKIKELEQKLNDYEDKWYKKFSAMETAMAKMQSNTNAVTALLGG